MGTPLDGQVGFVIETAWNSASVPARFLEVLADSSDNFDPMQVQGQGLRVTTRFPRGARRQAGIGQGDITVKAEAQSKAFGLLLQLCCGIATSNTVSGTTFQQLFSPALTTPFLPSATIQFGVPEVDTTGTVQPRTYKGCTVKSWTLDAPEGEIPTLSVDFWAASYTSAQALAAASYATAPTTYGPAATGCSLGGALTIPTTTALGTGGTSTTAIRSWTLTVDNGLKTRPGTGVWQQPVAGAPKATLKIKRDFDTTAYATAQVSQTTTSFAGWYTGAALGTGTERLQVDIPQMMLSDGAFAKLSDDEPDVPELTFDVTEDGTNEGFYVTVRTADTAL